MSSNDLHPTLEQLAQEVRTLLALDNVDSEASLMELGIDSLSIIDLLIACERIYGRAPDTRNVGRYTSLRELDESMHEAVEPA